MSRNELYAMDASPDESAIGNVTQHSYTFGLTLKFVDSMVFPVTTNLLRMA